MLLMQLVPTTGKIDAYVSVHDYMSSLVEIFSSSPTLFAFFLIRSTSKLDPRYSADISKLRAIRNLRWAISCGVRVAICFDQHFNFPLHVLAVLANKSQPFMLPNN